MDSSNDIQEPSSQADRVGISQDSISLIDGWLKQLSEKQKGFYPSRKQIVGWLINRHPTALSKKEEDELIAKFYDEEKALKFALKDIRLKKRIGEKSELAGEILCQTHKKATPKVMKNSVGAHGQLKSGSN